MEKDDIRIFLGYCDACDKYITCAKNGLCLTCGGLVPVLLPFLRKEWDGKHVGYCLECDAFMNIERGSPCCCGGEIPVSVPYSTDTDLLKRNLRLLNYLYYERKNSRETPLIIEK